MAFKNREYNSKRIFQAAAATVCAAALVLLCAFEIRREVRHDVPEGVRASSEDGAVTVTWDLPEFTRASGIKITVTDSKGTVRDEEVLSPHAKSWSFTEGVHGEKYTFSIKKMNRDGSVYEASSVSALFLDFDRLPDLPTVYMETRSGEDPVYTDARRPDGAMGATITGNDYVSGDMTLKWSGHETVFSRMKIRVRGNTSAVLLDKKPYLLRLHEPQDLLALGSSHACRDWTLLNVGDVLNNYVGNYLGELCGSTWHLNGMFVNVMLNDDWKGIYYLSEPVDRTTAGAEVSKDGYIFENDIYWWKPGTAYFRTSGQNPSMAFTFRYPNLTNADGTRAVRLKNYMEKVTKLITSEDSSLSDYIDYGSFASWVMVRDIMHTADPSGTNLYYYLYDLDEQDYTKYKLKMGPLWDFDASMRNSLFINPEMTGWSDQHITDFTYFPNLFDMADFRKVYRERWEEVYGKLEEGLKEQFEDLLSSEGKEVDESRALDAARWDMPHQTLEEEVRFDEDFIHQRAEWINTEVEEW